MPVAVSAGSAGHDRCSSAHPRPRLIWTPVPAVAGDSPVRRQGEQVPSPHAISLSTARRTSAGAVRCDASDHSSHARWVEVCRPAAGRPASAVRWFRHPLAHAALGEDLDAAGRRRSRACRAGAPRTRAPASGRRGAAGPVLQVVVGVHAEGRIDRVDEREGQGCRSNGGRADGKTRTTC